MRAASKRLSRKRTQVGLEYAVIAAQAGDVRAFEALHAALAQRVLAHARRLVGAQAAADVAQEAWIGIARNLKRLDDPSRVVPWCYAITTRRAVDHLRRTGRDRRLDQALSAEPLEHARPVERERPALERALDALPPPARALLSLFYVEELTVGEIAEALRLPPGTVKSRLFHLRHKLRQLMEGQIE